MQTSREVCDPYVYRRRITLAQNHNPDLSHLPQDRHGYPTLPDEEWANWEPIRPIIAEYDYDIAHVFNSGWMRRVTNPDFTGNGNPAVAVIHKDQIPNLHAAMGGEVPVEDPASTVLGHWDAYLEAIADADDDFNRAVDEAQRKRVDAYQQANTVMLEALAHWERAQQ